MINVLPVMGPVIAYMVIRTSYANAPARTENGDPPALRGEGESESGCRRVQQESARGEEAVYVTRHAFKCAFTLE